ETQQRAGRARQDHASVRDPSDSGRHQTADDTERDKTDCGPHDHLPSGVRQAIEVPADRAGGPRIEPQEMSTVVRVDPIGRWGPPCHLYSVTLPLSVPVPNPRAQVTSRWPSTVRNPFAANF